MTDQFNPHDGKQMLYETYKGYPIYLDRIGYFWERGFYTVTHLGCRRQIDAFLKDGQIILPKERHFAY